jgi:hypothetical protein
MLYCDCLQITYLLLTSPYLSSLRVCLLAKDLNTLLTFPRPYQKTLFLASGPLSPRHTHSSTILSEHFESKPQSPLNKLFGKSPEDTWAMYTCLNPLKRSYKRTVLAQYAMHFRRLTAAISHQGHNSTTTLSPTQTWLAASRGYPTNEITTFSNVQWRTLFNFRFSILMPGLRTSGVCISCGTVPLTSMNTNTHALNCNSQKRLGRTVRHGLALLVIDDFLTSIGVPH